jgi:hypothetical protein
VIRSAVGVSVSRSRSLHRGTRALSALPAPPSSSVKRCFLPSSPLLVMPSAGRKSRRVISFLCGGGFGAFAWGFLPVTTRLLLRGGVSLSPEGLGRFFSVSWEKGANLLPARTSSLGVLTGDSSCLGALFDLAPRRRGRLPASCALLAVASAIPLPSACAEGGAPTSTVLPGASAAASVGVRLAGDAGSIFRGGLVDALATEPVPETNLSSSSWSSWSSTGTACPSDSVTPPSSPKMLVVTVATFGMSELSMVWAGARTGVVACTTVSRSSVPVVPSLPRYGALEYPYWPCRVFDCARFGVFLFRLAPDCPLPLICHDAGRNCFADRLS